MDRTERFYKMEQLLRAQKVVPRRQFMDEIGVSLATFKRDLEYMRERLHAPIAFNSERGGLRAAGGRAATGRASRCRGCGSTRRRSRRC